MDVQEGHMLLAESVLHLVKLYIQMVFGGAVLCCNLTRMVGFYPNTSTGYVGDGKSVAISLSNYPQLLPQIQHQHLVTLVSRQAYTTRLASTAASSL